MLALFPVCALAVWLMARRWSARGLKARLSHMLRYVLLALTILSLAGTSVMGPASDQAAWLLVDASASVSSANLSELVQEALSEAEPGQKIGVIAFGGNAMIETPLSDAPTFSGVQTAVDASGSDLEEALLLASALLPSDHAGGIAIISDGLVTDTDASDLQRRGIPVNALKVVSGSSRDAQVTQVQAPATVYQGQSFTVTVTIHSTVESDAKVILLTNRTATATRDVTLRKGENTFVFQDVAATSGVVTYEAQVSLTGDGNSRNDRMGAYVAVTGAPGILLVEGREGEGTELRKMLQASGMTVQTVAPGMLSEAAADYRAWHAIALVNVDADTLTEAQIAALSIASRELGRGVAVFGGDSSYALGGYRGSSLEAMLPVTIDVKNKLDLPSTALLLVIDKSGSMTAGQFGVTRLEVAKEAAARAIEVLTPQDLAGVITFDDEGKWVFPLTNVTDAAALQELIGTIRPGGGTAFFTPLSMALEAMSSVTAQHKHIIFLTDGQSGDHGYETLVETMAQHGITLTAVAVGDGADKQVMLRLAELGGGRAYAAGEFDNVPKIFTKETLLVAGTYVQNRTFTPIVTDAALTDFPGFPQLTGYLATTEKPLATVAMVSDREDPILAWWQYGAGRVLCWTSDVQGGWSESFLHWDDAAAFFGGLLSHVLPGWEQSGEMTMTNGMLTYLAPEGTEGTVTARIVTPDGETQDVPLEQVAHHRYEAAVDDQQSGAYAVQVIMQQNGQTVATLEGGAVIPYAREYDLRVTDAGALEQLTSNTGGQLATSAADLLTFQKATARTRHDLLPWLMTAALLLLLLDIAQRRLNWEKALPRPSDEAKPKRKKPTPSPKQKPISKQPSDPTQTSQQLWENLQHRKRL